MIRHAKRLLLIESAEQQRIYHGVDVLARSFSPTSPHDASEMNAAAAKSKRATSKSQAHNLLKNMNWAPLDAAALYVMLYCKRQIATGERQIYRGVPSARGDALHRVFDHALLRLETARRMTADVFDGHRAELAELIRDAG